MASTEQDGERVRLSELADADSPTLFTWINDRALVELSSTFKPVDRADHDRWFATIRTRPDTRIFAIRTTADDRLIGTCQLLNIDPRAQSAELQIRIGDPAARGRGYGTEAVRMLVAFGFDQLDLRRIALHVLITNVAAQRTYEKVGFVREGVMPDAAVVGGQPVDALTMAIARG
ncbi:MAG TPA: GNAT family protein [Vicinamibacterales bacterium]|nr:GNAT family protein [Vicinamibacterales bacterium]